MESSPVQEPCVGKPVLILCSVQLSCSVVSNSLWPHEPQYARPPCPSPTPGVHPNPWPLYHQESPVSPILSFRGFIVLCFILRSLDHFKLILMRGGIRSVSSFSLFFFFFVCGYPVVLSFVEKTAFTPLYSLCSFVKVVDYICVGSFSGSSFRFHCSICLCSLEFEEYVEHYFIHLSIIWNLFSCLGNFPTLWVLVGSKTPFPKWAEMVDACVFIFLLAKAQVCSPISTSQTYPFQTSIHQPMRKERGRLTSLFVSFSLCYVRISSMDLVVVAVLRYWGLCGTRTVQDLELIDGGRNFLIRPNLQWDFGHYSSKLSFMPSSQTTHNSRRFSVVSINSLPMTWARISFCCL